MSDALELLLDWPLCGRREELAFVGARVAADEPGVLITGGPGIGKSRLAREVVAAVAREGRPTEVVLCTAATADVPYAALSRLIGSVGADSPFDRALDELRHRPRPTVLAIDNADRLDRRSSAVVQQAIVEGLVFVVATRRTGAGIDVATLWRDLGLVRVELQPLSEREVAEMLAAGLGGDVDGVAVRRIWRVSAGVPLFVRELAIEGVRREALIQERGVWVLNGSLPAPASLSDLLEVRLDGLDPEATRCAEVLAVAETLPAEVLAPMVHPDAVDDLERAGVVRVEDDLYRFTHPLFGELVSRAMSSTRRRRVMGELADAVAVGNRPEDVVRLATWRLGAGDGASPTLLGDAAHLAYQAGDFRLARRLAEAASDAGSVEGSLLLGQMLHEAGEHVAAEERNRSFRLDGLAPPLARRAAVQRAVNLFFGLGRGDEALAALRQDPDGMPFNRAWLLLNMGRIDEARSALPPDHADRVSLLVTSAWVASTGGRPDVALGYLDELDGHPADPSLAPGRFRDFPDLPRTLALLEAGRPEAAAEVALGGHDVAVDRHPPFIRSWWLFLLARIELDRGAMASAVSLFRRGEAIQAGMNQPGLASWYVGGAAYALVQTGAGREVDALLAGVDELGERDERLFWFLVEAARLWRRLGRSDRDSVAAGFVALGDLEASRGSWAAARRLWFDAVRVGGAHHVEGRLDDGTTEFDRVRATVARGLVGDDGEMLEGAATWFDEAGLALWAAECWTWAGTVWTKRREARRAAAAARRADTARLRCESVATPGLVSERGPTPLTDREREVVTLAAGGLPSREIAEALAISVRTVDNLLQRAYVKLGVSSRREAAVALGVDVPE